MSRTLTATPLVDGFRMPAEWEQHAGCWIIWPERPDNWRDGAKPAQRAFVEVAAAIADSERVTVLASAGRYLAARAALDERVRVVEMSSNDSWVRDCGPTFVIDDHGGVAGVDWDFNAWGGLAGGLYFPWDQDDLVARKVLELEGVDRYHAGMVLEGGSIDVDGEGTLITTEECLLNPNRNPSFDRTDIARFLGDYLAVDTLIWLPRGVCFDETDGHVDNLARFVAPSTVVLTWTDDRDDPQWEVSMAAREQLESAHDSQGRRLTVVPLHQPKPVLITAQEALGVDVVAGTLPRTAASRLAASYVNSYIANGSVLVPVFGDPHDDAALDTYRQLFPDRHVEGIAAREILLGGGNVHCITQQQPAGTPRSRS